MMFVYLRDGDRVGAAIHRVLSNSPLLLDMPSRKPRVELPEGRDILEYRKEREAVGVEFRYRLVTFTDWLSDQDQKTVRIWRGLEDGGNYPPSPEGTFWSEYATREEKWTLSLLSMETGEPVEGHEELVASVREALIKKTQEKIKAKKAEAEPEASAEEQPSEAQEAAEEAEGSETVETPSEASETSEAASGEASEAAEGTAA